MNRACRQLMDLDPEARLAMYTRLGHTLNYPEGQLVEDILGGAVAADLEGGLKGLGLIRAHQCLCNLTEEYRSSGTERDELLLGLEKDYTWMCFASKPRLVHLFGSVYQEGKLMQESTFEVARLYYEAGLRLDEEFHLPPDHIAVELEFLAYLAFNEKASLDRRDEEKVRYARRLHAEFLENYLSPFAGRFAEALARNAKTGFYRTIAEILSGLFAGQE